MNRSRVFCIATFALLLLPGAAHATLIAYGAGTEFSGAQAPASATPPWIVVSFDDHDAVGSVDLTVTAPNLTASENILNLHLNLDPSQYGLLPLSFGGLVKGGAFDTPTISQGVDAFMADGDGKYDIMLSFTSGGTTANTFTNGDSLKYTITGAGLTAGSFSFLSTPAGGHGPFYFASHIQNTTGAGAGGSGWVTGPAIPSGGVPEPASATLALLACFGAALLRRQAARC
jgi:hypothetical protein